MERRNKPRCRRGFSLLRTTATACAFYIIAFSQPKTDEGYLVDQRTQWVSTVTDARLIALFMQEMHIMEENITKMEIIDANNNGFSKGDLLKTYPSEEIYFLDDPSEKLQTEMDRWKFQPNFTVTLENTQTPEMLERLPIQKAEYSIVASFLKGLKRNYRDYPLKAWIQRDSIGVSFEMWGYSDKNLKYTPPPPAGYDLVFIHKTLSDTLFIPK
jgi:hypothetical protein